MLNVSSQHEPQFYHPAIQYQEWREAIATKLVVMELNHTWSVAPLPKGTHTIGYRWIYKIKYKSDGSTDRHKARL